MSVAAYVAAVVGEQEAEAVLDLVPEGLATARAALGWLRQRSTHVGVLPGTDVVVDLQLSGGTWSGHVWFRGHRFEVGPADECLAAATVAAVVGAVPGEAVTDRTAARLGRTLDAILAGSRPSPQPQPLRLRPVAVVPVGVVVVPPAVRVDKLAAPVVPRKSRGVLVSQEAAEAACGVCGGAQAIGTRLHGCLCWRDLLTTARVARLHHGWLVTPGPDWGSDGVAAFAEACRG